METFSDLAPLAAYLVSGSLNLAAEDFDINGLEQERIVEILQFALWQLEAERHWERDRIFNSLKGLADAMEVKLKQFLAPLFVAIAGSQASISVMDSMVLLGPDMSRARIRHAIEVLGGVSKKAMKRLEKEYRAL